MIRRLLALAGIGLGLFGVGAFIFVGIKVWSIKAEVNRQTAYFSAQAGAAGDAADRAVAFVREIISKAKGDLGVMRLQPAIHTGGSVNPILRITAIQASQELLGSVERAQGAVLAATDAVKVADEALVVAGKYLNGGNNYPQLETMLGVNPESLKASRTALNSITHELQNARNILGVSPGSQVLTPEEYRAVNAALDKANELTDIVAHVVKTARGRVIHTQMQIDQWAVQIAWGTTILAALGMVGQFFLIRYCVRKLMLLPA